MRIFISLNSIPINIKPSKIANLIPPSLRFLTYYDSNPKPRSSSSSSTSSSSAMSMAASLKKTASVSCLAKEEGIARRLWIKFRKEAIFATFTPFVVCLASGNLKLQTFRDYMAQDAHFLKAFAQAYELAEDCADDDDLKLEICQLRKGVLEELKLHDSFMKEWGPEFVKEYSLNSATLKYTEFLLATASGKVEGVKGPGKLATPFEKTKVAAYTLGAMTPCMRLYAFLGKEFLSFLGSDKDTHPYKKWIDKYSSDDFQASALQSEDLLDKLSVSLTGEELDVIDKLYHQAMKLEINFFCAQPLVQPTVVPLIKGHRVAQDRLMIFSDFDLTCTVVDSSAILAEIAIVTAPKSDQIKNEQSNKRMSSSDLKNLWGLLSSQYTEEYEHCIESILPAERVKEFNYQGLHEALEQLSTFEKKANSRVIDSGVLKGLNVEDIKRAGERLVLQECCTNFFQRIVDDESLNANVHVLSYCWCGDLIRSAFSSGSLQSLSVHSNDFVYEESISTGEIFKKMESPIDKVETFNNILKDTGGDRKNLTVYIGDSVGDILCLLEADVGIVIGSSSSLRRVGSQFGVSFVPLFTGLVKKQKECIESNCPSWKGRSGILYTVSSWAEIHAFILGW